LKHQIEDTLGLLGPIARLDLTNPSNSRYYILDALGHTRLLLDNTGNITDTYVYDAWGNLLKGSEFNTPNPFTWNGAYGYEWIEFTGLYHVGAREYDPRTARWLQRDPIGVGGGHPNVYRYCQGEPVNTFDLDGFNPQSKVPYPGGHHIIPVEVWRDLNLPQDVRDVFGYAATGPSPGHCGSHPLYTRAVRKLWDDWLQKNRITDLTKITKAQAEEFVKLILNSELDEIKNFLQGIANGQKISLQALKTNVLTSVTTKGEWLKVVFAKTPQARKKALNTFLRKFGQKLPGFIARKSGILTGVFFVYDWWTGGFGHACNEALWPLSELWDGN